jgi:hypothetical protein
MHIISHKIKDTFCDGHELYRCPCCGGAVQDDELDIVVSAHMPSVAIATCGAEVCRENAEFGVKRILR